MLKEFLHFLEKEQLLDTDSRVLLAVSGGVDSVAMGHLFQKAGLSFGVGHCNFQLRGQASDEDERFVLGLAEAWGVPAFSRRFDTETYARETGQSVQLAARMLRYAWLEEVRQENSFTHIATAHHLNDSIETLFFNLTKGCGIRGLHGIPLKNGLIIRPLLFASREQLEQYAGEQNIAYREDVTNRETKYQRNKIRQRVIPVLKEINPSFEPTMAENIDRFRQLEHLLDWAMRHIAQEAILSYGDPFRLSIEELETFDSVLPTVLFEFLHPYGFNSSQVQQLSQSLNNTGAIFLSPGYRLLVEREEIVVEKTTEKKEIASFHLTPETRDMAVPGGRLNLSYQEGPPTTFPKDSWQTFLDADSLEFPLTLRHWRAGDVFQPLGMEGKHQKLQDFFNNQKVSRFNKEKVWILEDATGRICWVVGHRVDERCKLSPSTRNYWALKFQKA
ncbi:MAG: tRNA lysidine(34) synthetase TilS [Lewinellaceae bacterium]|nr:tRNA lysidine(34) synthetase TilS [Phaeodactylibacter sp.]MCB0613648.1 tRNA lysidine(34) synthetase TilS [Phaeodactylibacter sp.]MCB9349372.1 tRNA lysidine(34) synthetase TilS [Lewinellaceae bacterium]